MLRLSTELVTRFKLDLGEPLPEDYHRLKRAFRKVLRLAAQTAWAQDTVIFIIVDGVNMLQAPTAAMALDWLPLTLKMPGVSAGVLTVMVTTPLSADATKSLAARSPAPVSVHIHPLDVEEQLALMRVCLYHRYRKTLTAEQQKLLLQVRMLRPIEHGRCGHREVFHRSRGFLLVPSRTMRVESAAQNE